MIGDPSTDEVFVARKSMKRRLLTDPIFVGLPLGALPRFSIRMNRGAPERSISMRWKVRFATWHRPQIRWRSPLYRRF
jgi:hypothetical protein